MKTLNNTLNTRKKLTSKAISIALAGGLTLCAAGFANAHDTVEHIKESAQQTSQEAKTIFSNGWKEGKMEAAFLFNEHLNNFTIDSEVDKNTAILRGEVNSDIQKDLAREVALSIEGIDRVDNRLEVVPESKDKSEPKEQSEFISAIEDATISARLKMKMIVNDNLSGFAIDVDTEDNVVTLKGEVRSEAQKALAEVIAKNDESVESVRNELRVVHS